MDFDSLAFYTTYCRCVKTSEVPRAANVDVRLIYSHSPLMTIKGALEEYSGYETYITCHTSGRRQPAHSFLLRDRMLQWIVLARGRRIGSYRPFSVSTNGSDEPVCGHPGVLLKSR